MLKGTTLVVDVVVGQSGFAGRTVPLVVEDEGQAIASQDVTLPPDGEPATVRVRFTLAEAGPRVLHFRIPRAGRRAGDAEQRARGAGDGRRTGASRSSTSRASRGPR
ncbi:MAG: hypothetical protein MZU95_01325 [Desulfomicrobium escambiense]|nr:hypothetical protein [Desulfomicrobium escambiense]